MTIQNNHETAKLPSNTKGVLQTLWRFMSNYQLMAVTTGFKGDERIFFINKVSELALRIDAMPKTGEQEGLGDSATVYLHYFLGGSDWYILEKDSNQGQLQAFGYVCLNGYADCAELGYISIQELTKYGAELDLHFAPCTLASVKEKHEGPIFLS